MEPTDDERCPGCGVVLPPLDGARHPYVGASSACWTRFAEISASLPFVTPLRRVVTDAYMVQHPGIPERRAIQSVGLHLIALDLVLERALPPDRLSVALQSILVKPPAWRWLEPPVPNGHSTIIDVGAALSTASAADVMASYVRDIWESWAPHRATVDAWLDASRVGTTPRTGGTTER